MAAIRAGKKICAGDDESIDISAGQPRVHWRPIRAIVGGKIDAVAKSSGEEICARDGKTGDVAAVGAIGPNPLGM